MKNSILIDNVLKHLILFTCIEGGGILLPKVLVNSFLIDLKDKFGLVCFLDNSSRRSYLMFLKDIINSTEIIEFSEGCKEYSNMVIEDKTQGYLFKEVINNKDEYFKPANKEELDEHYKGVINVLANLPVASIDNVGDIYWVQKEEYYYQCISEERRYRYI